MVILAAGAHPDDVEIGMGGTIALHANRGDIVYICNVTKGELSSNGTVETRQQEAARAAAVLGVAERYQLHFPDRSLSQSHPEYYSLVSLIRELKPDVIFAPYKDRHPDHGACGEVVQAAIFDAGIKRFPKVKGAPHKTAAFYQYFINGVPEPDFYMDISRSRSVKEKALLAYESQFVKKPGSVDTPLTDQYIETVRRRDLLFGKEAGTEAAEGFKQVTPFLFSALPKRGTDS
nr:bacillithiol biosynthesis deacetylase BshB1 [Bacillus piscicola]